MAFERCHDTEELQRLIGSAGGYPRTGPQRGSAAGRHGRYRAAAAWSWAGCEVRTRWLRPIQYKVRDRGGNMVTGTLVADNERSSCSACARWATRRSRSARRSKGLNIEINIRKPKVKLKELCRLLAAVRDDGQLRAADPARPRDPGRADDEQGARAKRSRPCRIDVEQGASLSGAMPKHPKVFNDLYISMVKSGETGGSLDDVAAALAGHAREAGRAARQDQVGDDLPGRGRRARRADHVGDAAVRRAAVRGHLRAARRHSSRCRRRSC